MSTRFTQAQADAHQARFHPAPTGHLSAYQAQAAQKEAALHREILDECRRQGWGVLHQRMDKKTTSAVGSSDFVIALPLGRTCWVEAKTARGKVRPEQAAWMRMLRRLGHEAVIVRSLAEFNFLLKQRDNPPDSNIPRL